MLSYDSIVCQYDRPFNFIFSGNHLTVRSFYDVYSIYTHKPVWSIPQEISLISLSTSERTVNYKFRCGF